MTRCGLNDTNVGIGLQAGRERRPEAKKEAAVTENPVAEPVEVRATEVLPGGILVPTVTAAARLRWWGLLVAAATISDRRRSEGGGRGHCLSRRWQHWRRRR
jgi:hypothetical protein